MTAHWAGSHAGIGAEFKLAAEQVLHASLVHDQHDQINRLRANLQAKAAAYNGEESRIAPSLGSSATSHSAAIPSAEDEASLQHRRNHSHALRRTHDFVWNAGIGGSLNLFQDGRGGLHPVSGLVVIVIGSKAGGGQAECQEQQEELFHSFHTFGSKGFLT